MPGSEEGRDHNRKDEAHGECSAGCEKGEAVLKASTSVGLIYVALRIKSPIVNVTSSARVVSYGNQSANI